MEHCQLPHCREGFFLTLRQNQDACQQTLDPTSPGICPLPEREAWEVGCLSLPPGACWTAPDHAFHPSRADLGGISGCVGGPALVLEDEKYMEAAFPLLQRRHTCFMGHCRKPPCPSWRLNNFESQCLHTATVIAIIDCVPSFWCWFTGSPFRKQDAPLVFLVPTNCSSCISMGLASGRWMALG